MFFKDNSGFTLMEMLMVMFIIAVLLLLVIPNIMDSKESAEETGCLAYRDTVQTQVVAYQISNNGDTPSSLEVLKSEGYITSTTCSNGTQLSLDASGNVKIVN